MRRAFLIMAVALSLLGCSSLDKGTSAAYGGYTATADPDVPVLFTLRKEDRVAVVFPSVPYREERSLELSSREYLSSRGILSLAVSDVYPASLEEDVDWNEVLYALTDAETDYLLVVSVVESREYPSGGIAGRVYEVSIRDYRSGRTEGSISVTVLGSGDQWNSYEDTLVPVARAFAKALGEALLVLSR